jgi:methyl-accepting chemotaxis protein
MKKIAQFLFGNLSILKKMLVIGFTTFLSFILLSLFFLNKEKEMMINEKKLKLINLVELSYSLLDKEYSRYKSGEISENTAKQNALRLISSLKYNSKNYIWINSASKTTPKMISHPVASLIGKTLDDKKFECVTKLEFGDDSSKSRNINNENIFKMSVEVTSKAGSGFISYLWNKNVNDKNPSPKLSYVKHFKQWGWILGTGIYIDDVNEQFYANTMKAVLIIAIVLVLLSIIFTMIVSDIVIKVKSLNFGLSSFFDYLNRKSDDVDFREINFNDEFGEMSKLIYLNIEKTKKGIDEDRELISETIIVLSEFAKGDLFQRLDINVSNPALMQLKDVLNKMAINLEQNIDNVLNILEEYSNYNYLNKINKKDLKEHLLGLANGVNNLGDSITHMLIENKSNGITLDKSSNTLLTNVKTLNENSTNAAVALEETAAALEEVTSNISSNTENVMRMSNFANELIVSAKNGQSLAKQTTSSMDQINIQVTAINDAIIVIDQIAFQTNILSLNAAVEAATAGEAGKGFAVVAQEVRNLASRSAEAAKEIKDIVEKATIKANQGKNISNQMIDGYNELNENINKTLDTISQVEMASKEQLVGIEQINDAVASLDQQTQQNALIASNTQKVANDTDLISKKVINSVNLKKFNDKVN